MVSRNPFVGLMLVAIVARVGMAGAAPETTDAPLPTMDTASDLYGDCEDPIDMLLLSRERIGTDRELAAALVSVRTRYPELFGGTRPPTGAVRLPAQFEPASTLLLAYPGVEDYDGWFVEVVAEAAVEGEVVILVDALDREALRALLVESDVDPGAVTLIDDIPFESVWIRDYGPIAVETERGIAFVDPRYFLNCLYNDAVPTHLALDLGPWPVIRPPLWLEGGDLLSNGAGICFSTSYSAQRNGITEDRYRALLEAYFGCQQTVMLRPMAGNAPEHVDLFLTVAAEDLVLLAEFDADEDPANAAIMEHNLAALEDLRTAAGGALQVDRVPMPPAVERLPRDPAGPVIRSYLNLVIFNGVVLVPVYPRDAEFEDDALRQIRRAFPTHRVVPIPVETLALDAGALHCVTVTVPARRDSR